MTKHKTLSPSMATDLDSLREIQFGLKYLPYTVRQLIKTQQLIGCQIWDQIVLITWCHNYSPHRVNTSVKKMIQTQETYQARDIILRLLCHETRSFGTRMTHEIAFTKQSVKALLMVDSTLLYGDYGDVRWEQALEVLECINEDMVSSIVNASGKCSMSIALLKLEDYVRSQNSILNQLSSMTVHSTDLAVTPLDEASQQHLKTALTELQHIRKTEKQYDGFNKPTK